MRSAAGLSRPVTRACPEVQGNNRTVRRIRVVQQYSQTTPYGHANRHYLNLKNLDHWLVICIFDKL